VTRPLAVAITGGIGAGKSTLLAALRAHGAATVSSDEIVHHLLADDAEIRTALLERFGDGILGEDGRPDRRRIGERVFGDREALDWLEQLLYPRVSAEYLRWREQLATLPHPPRVCVTEVPLLFEAGSEKLFDKIVVITAPAALREQRRRVPLDGRDARLLPDREKVRKADFHFVNRGTEDELETWVDRIMDELTRDVGPTRDT
jgi:dephospho-CoA kinase